MKENTRIILEETNQKLYAAFRSVRQRMNGEKLMAEKDLRKLSRAELLEMLIAQSTELQECQEKLAATEADLKKREISIQKAGSIAEAALVLNGVFDAAQAACQQYTENIRQLSDRQEKAWAEWEEQSRAKAKQIISEAEQKREDMERETEERCAEMIRKAQEESQKYWDEAVSRLNTFADTHAGSLELQATGIPPEK